nr:hypothetical protein [Tanacetum cinerariifolium]GEZ19811.1 hypothetical protein [Tanacetum cinerariifolium]
ADYEDEYQGELQGDSQKDKLTTAMMLLARAITQKFSTPTNSRLHTSSNIGNQAVIQDGRVHIQTKNAGTGNDESNQIVQRVPQTESNLRKANVECYDSMKDEAESNLKDEENDFMLNISYRDETLEELTAAVIMMAQIQSADDNAASEPSYDAKAVSKKGIAAQPKMYDGEMLHSTSLKIDSPDSEKTLEDTEEIRLKMRNKMVKLNYEKLNALYETFVPQQEPSAEQTYFSIPSTSNDCSEIKEVTSDLSNPQMPKESKLLKMFEKIGLAINDL